MKSFPTVKTYVEYLSIAYLVYLLRNDGTKSNIITPMYLFAECLF